MDELASTASKYPVSLSTMTVLIRINNQVSFDTILERFNDPRVQDFITSVTGSIDNLTLSTSAKKRNFSNSLVIKCSNILTDHDTIIKGIAAKIFCNGNIHVTGAKSTQDAYYLGEVLATLLEIIHGGSGLSDQYKILDFDVQMINYYFTNPSPPPSTLIDLAMLHSKLQENTPYYAQYNTERYSGVIVKAPRYTYLIFDSGNVILSLQDPKDLKEAYTYICDFFSSHGPSFYINTPLSIISKQPKSLKSKKKPFDYGKYLVLK